jgi:hypothetical protein
MTEGSEPRDGLLKAITSCTVCFDRLLIDGRGGRRGFPAQVLRELVALKEYYDKINPQSASAWTNNKR